MVNFLDIAHTMGHKAADHLFNAFKISREAYELNSAKATWQEAMVLGVKLEYHRKSELQECAVAIILFQSMMEAVMNHEINNNTKLKVIKNVKEPCNTCGEQKRDPFAKNWQNAFDYLTASKAGNESLQKYLEFYRKYRNPLIHPNNRDGLKNVENFRFPLVYLGIRNGWLAFAELSEKLGTPHDKNSWEIFCASHGLPETIDESNFPDIHMLACAMNKKHLDGARSALEK